MSTPVDLLPRELAAGHPCLKVVTDSGIGSAMLKGWGEHRDIAAIHKALAISDSSQITRWR